MPEGNEPTLPYAATDETRAAAIAQSCAWAAFVPAERARTTGATRTRRSHREAAAAAKALLLVLAWAMAVVTGSTLDVENEAVHRAALFAHLLSLVVGFGAVIVVDAYGLLWLFGRRRAADISALVSAGHALICLGLAGLLASGALLHPDPGSGLTRIKLGLVLAVLLNGYNAHRLSRRLRRLPPHLRGEDMPWDYAWRVFLASAISQIGWWGAIVIGFLNTTSRLG